MEEEISTIALEAKFDRATQTYKPQDWISGNVRVYNPQGGQLQKIVHNGLKLKAEGILTAQNKATNKTLEGIGSILNPLTLFKYETTITCDDITKDICVFPFKFKFSPVDGEELFETYVGVYISVSYELQVELKISGSPSIKQLQPWFVQVQGQGKNMVKENFFIPRPALIEMFPDKLLPNTSNKNIPKFKVTGELESDICNFVEDIRGYFNVEECDGKIRTIDLQLIRVEKIENRLGKFSEATEIQLIQVADGNVTRKIDIPLFMIFPIYFCCPNFTYKEYTVEFELNFIMILFDGFKITLNFPLNILRL